MRGSREQWMDPAHDGHDRAYSPGLLLSDVCQRDGTADAQWGEGAPLAARVCLQARIRFDA
jgi:hypothetical protein